MYNELSIYFLSISFTKLKKYSYEVQTNDNTLSISEIVKFPREIISNIFDRFRNFAKLSQAPAPAGRAEFVLF